MTHLLIKSLIFIILIGSPLAAKAPNVILVMTDDQGYGDFGITGNQVLQTPNLDRFAAQGTWVSDFHVSPLCAPTRAALLTGRYPLRSGVHGVTRGAENMDPNAITIAELFQAAGYRTGNFGKWHNGSSYPYHPNSQGFDEFVGFTAGHIGNYFDTILEKNGEPYQSKGYIADVFTDHTIEFIETESDRPFFAYVTLNTPHSPWQAPEDLYQKYKAMKLDDYHATCYAMVENIDENFGRIIQALDNKGIRDHTIVLFTSDNGPNGARFNSGYREHKGHYYEGGTRVPLFIQWPDRLAPQRKLEALTAHIDLLPTLANWCGLDTSSLPDLDGIDRSSYIEGLTKTVDDRQIIFHDFRGRADNRAALRTERWRAVRINNEWELYDLRVDPSERVNLAAFYPEILEGFAQEYDVSFADVVKGLETQHPMVIGHPERPNTYLATHEATLRGKGIAYEGKHGWAHDWVSGWHNSKARIVWPVKSMSDGAFEVILEYSAEENQTGSELTVQFLSSKTSAYINQAAIAQRLPNLSKFEFKEADDLHWKTISLGTIKLEAGKEESVKLMAKIPKGKEAPWIKGIHLNKID